YQRSRGRTGLTIPFLVGATHKPTTYEPIEEGAAFTELTSLLVSFRDVTPHSHCVVMAECVDLLEPIAALYPSGGGAYCEPVPDPSSAGIGASHTSRGLHWHDHCSRIRRDRWPLDQDL